MDGVTDAPYRLITARYGHPALTVTEFTSVEGIRAGATRLLDDFLYDPLERPVVAQLFGADPEAFFLAAVVASALGFDGIDINMGCPAKNVTSHGAGAALILDPERASHIIERAKAGAKAWTDGITLEEAGVTESLLPEINLRRHRLGIADERPSARPVSVKTRMGYHQPVVETWISHLLESKPAAISLHGRTLKQLYTGDADWESIGKAATLVRQTPTLILGNGDISSLADAHEKISIYGVDGVLIGRASQGNPWVFTGENASLTQRLQVALEHARLFDAAFPPAAFVRMRKHLLDYVKGFEGAKELRTSLMRVNGLAEVEALLLPATRQE